MKDVKKKVRKSRRKIEKKKLRKKPRRTWERMTCVALSVRPITPAASYFRARMKVEEETNPMRARARMFSRS